MTASEIVKSDLARALLRKGWDADSAGEIVEVVLEELANALVMRSAITMEVAAKVDSLFSERACTSREEETMAWYALVALAKVLIEEEEK